MASKLTTCFVCWNLNLSFRGINCHHPSSIVRFPASPSHRLLPASCKMRHRTFSSQHKKQQIKKASSEQPPTDGDPHPNQDEDSEHRKMSLDNAPNSNKEVLSSTDTENSNSVQHTHVENLNSPIVIPETTSLVSLSTD